MAPRQLSPASSFPGAVVLGVVSGTAVAFSRRVRFSVSAVPTTEVVDAYVVLACFDVRASKSDPYAVRIVLRDRHWPHCSGAGWDYVEIKRASRRLGRRRLRTFGYGCSLRRVVL